MRRSEQETRVGAAPDVAATLGSAKASPEHALVEAVLAAQMPGVRARAAEFRSYYTPEADRSRPVAAPADLASEIRAAQNGGR